MRIHHWLELFTPVAELLCQRRLILNRNGDKAKASEEISHERWRVHFKVAIHPHYDVYHAVVGFAILEVVNGFVALIRSIFVNRIED